MKTVLAGMVSLPAGQTRLLLQMLLVFAMIVVQFSIPSRPSLHRLHIPTIAAVQSLHIA